MQKFTTKNRIVFVVLFSAICFPLSGCLSESRAPARKSPTRKFFPPTHILLFQPKLKWANGQTTFQGTGFFVRRDDRSVAAVTSAHFFNFNGPALLEIEFLDVVSGIKLSATRNCLGKPGNGGSDDTLELKADHMIFPVDPVDESFLRGYSLELDKRQAIQVGEGIYFPNKIPANPGFEYVEGTVKEVTPGYIAVVLAHRVKLESQSGSPIISQETGKVVGILARGGPLEDGTTVLALAPLGEVNNIVFQNSETFDLREVVGNQKTKPVSR